jgi:hypothetical protein
MVAGGGVAQGAFIGMVVGGVIAWVIPAFLQKTVGTKYRTEDACKDCETRRAVDEIRTLVVELAIKAGVPAHDIAKMARHPLSKGRP